MRFGFVREFQACEDGIEYHYTTGRMDDASMAPHHPPSHLNRGTSEASLTQGAFPPV